MLAAADVGAVLAVSVVAGLLEGASAGVWTLATLPLWLVLAKLHGLYDRDHRTLRHLTVDELPSLASWAATGAVATKLLLLPTPAEWVGIAAALLVWGVAVAVAFTLRSLARAVWRRITPPERTLVLGSGALADATVRKLALFPDIHTRVVAQEEDLQAARDDADSWAGETDRVIVASDGVDLEVVSSLVALCRRHRVKLSVVPPALGVFVTAANLTRVAELPVVEYNTWDVSRSTLVLKRVLDLAVAVPLVVLFAPVFVLVALAIRLDSRGNPFFVQDRAGRGGQPFRMIKFRTMVEDAHERLRDIVALEELDDPMFKLEHDPRITRLGRFLRRTSLDELPQLLNVVRGDMSLVGPRPEQVELVRLYRDEHRFRLAVKPGVTGPMQVFGRGALTFEERLAVERDYIENLSFGRDLRILALTLAAVAGGRGAF